MVGIRRGGKGKRRNRCGACARNRRTDESPRPAGMGVPLKTTDKLVIQ
jgi:hypothetical protein